MPFKKGDPKAREAGRAGGLISKPKLEHVKKVEPTIMDQIRALAPKAVEALDRLVERDDQQAIKIVMERVAPKVLVEDAEVQAALTELRNEIEHMRQAYEALEADRDRLAEELEFEKKARLAMTPPSARQRAKDNAQERCA